MPSSLLDSKLYLAVEAGLPLIHVVTDDLHHVQEDLAAACDLQPKQIRSPPSVDSLQPRPSNVKMAPSTRVVHFGTANVAHATMEKYENHNGTIILVGINQPHEQSALAFDVGFMPFNEARFDAAVSSVALSSTFSKADLMRAVSGLSTVEAIRVVRIAKVRHPALDSAAIKETRQWLYGLQKGLMALSVDLPAYSPPEELTTWLQDNAHYFISPDVPRRLVPKGLLFDGPPGTGKTTAAKYLARELNVPLYRLDIASALDKYIGVSEQRVAEALAQADREGPCVLLIDEAEKIFTYGDDDAVPARIMSQLLWWLQEHKGRVLTVMTTNDKDKLPPELYREGRIDAVVGLSYLGFKEAFDLAKTVLLSFAPPNSTLKESHVEALKKAVHAAPGMQTPASVTELVIRLAKHHKWL